MNDTVLFGIRFGTFTQKRKLRRWYAPRHRQGDTLGDSPLPVNVGPLLFFVGREPDAFLDSPSMSEEYWQESLDRYIQTRYIYIFSLPLGFPCGILHLLGQVYGPGIGVYFRQALDSLDNKLVSWTRILFIILF